MVRHLGVPLALYEGQAARPRATDRFALVDTQPNAGNNAFPEGLQAHVVIDHHPRRPELQASFVDIRPDAGCTTTLLLSYHQAYGLDLTPGLATAALYAIISETQDLDREATKADRDACLRLFPMVQLSTLGKIRHPPREREYFRTVARAMRQVMVGKNTCICHIGPVHSAEMAAELADFLVAMKQVTWCLVSGFADEQMVLSIRTTRSDFHAEQVMRRVVKGLGRGGGHDMMAGGALPCADLERYKVLSEKVSERFIAGLPRRAPEHLRPLLEEDTPEGQAPAGDGKRS
jgi:nanoRNase/pAp phosphatase (c-di-AMP/oligoRNAs hydrolase)